MLLKMVTLSLISKQASQSDEQLLNAIIDTVNARKESAKRVK
jgi:hypothetical protein